MAKTITVEAFVQKDCGLVWDFWTDPKHIVHWMHASETWECPFAENDLQVGGRFTYRFAAKDGSESFDLKGTYTAIDQGKFIAYTLDDNRVVNVSFEMSTDMGTTITETFEMENENTEDEQRGGWEAILANFKTYAEGN